MGYSAAGEFRITDVSLEKFNHVVYFDPIMHHSTKGDQFAFLTFHLVPAYDYHGPCTLRSVDFSLLVRQVVLKRGSNPSFKDDSNGDHNCQEMPKSQIIDHPIIS